MRYRCSTTASWASQLDTIPEERLHSDDHNDISTSSSPETDEDENPTMSVWDVLDAAKARKGIYDVAFHNVVFEENVQLRARWLKAFGGEEVSPRTVPSFHERTWDERMDGRFANQDAKRAQ